MKRSQAFPSKYLGKDDLDEPRIMTVRDVEQEDIESDGQIQTKAVMHFQERDAKPWIINVGNWMTIEDAYGEDSDDWIGKEVELYVDPSVMFGQKRVGGVRVRIPSAAKLAESSAPSGKPQTQRSTETVQQVDIKGEWFGITTDQGVFVTNNAQLGKNIQQFGNTACDFTYEVNGSGKRVLIAASPQLGEPQPAGVTEDDDIPF